MCAVAMPTRGRSGGEMHSPPGLGSDRSSLGLGIREHAAAQAPPFVVVRISNPASIAHTSHYMHDCSNACLLECMTARMHD